MADSHSKLLTEIKDRFQQAQEADSENRSKAEEDLRFAFEDGGQWQDSVRKDRADRPCYTYNRIEPVLDQIVGDQRQSRPQIKLRAVQDTDKEVTETFSGLIRNIESLSDAETVYDQQFLYALSCGSGNWRVINEYANDRSFDQDIFIRSIPNPFSVFWDPQADHPTKRDARWCMIVTRVPKDEYESKYPDKQIEDWHWADRTDDWFTDEGVRVCEYYRKVPKVRKLLLLSDGRTVYKDEVSKILDEIEGMGITIERERDVETCYVEWVKVTPTQVLEGPIKYDWTHIPVVHVCGKEINIAGKQLRKGLVRNAKDAQREYNYAKSAIAESVLMAPRVPYVVTPKQIKGFQRIWDIAHKKLLPYLPANADPDVPGGIPVKQPTNPVPMELVGLAQGAIDDIQATTGYYAPSLGEPSNEKSGRAIMARQKEGDTGSFVYLDNLGKAIRQTGEILLEMIPDIYDTERQVRILGEDGAEDFVLLNGPDGVVIDRSIAKFDVRVSIGPSYATQRQEAAERLMHMGTAWPTLFEIASDIIVRGLDMPESIELEKRIRKRLLQSGVVDPNPDDPSEQPAPDPVRELVQANMQAEYEGKVLDNRAKELKDNQALAELVGEVLDNAKKLQDILSSGVVSQPMIAAPLQGLPAAQAGFNPPRGEIP